MGLVLTLYKASVWATVQEQAGMARQRRWLRQARRWMGTVWIWEGCTGAMARVARITMGMESRARRVRGRYCGHAPAELLLSEAIRSGTFSRFPKKDAANGLAHDGSSSRGESATNVAISVADSHGCPAETGSTALTMHWRSKKRLVLEQMRSVR